MKCLSSLIALVVLGLGLTAPSSAQGIPGPRYVKKAVFVRIHWDRTFYEYWKIGRRYSDAQINTLVKGYFDRAKATYALNDMHNIDLFLLEDFDRVTGPMADYYDSNSPTGGDSRLLSAMRTRLKTGTVQRTVPNGTTHLLGRTMNWVFVHANYGGLGGAADVTIPSLGTADANAFFSTGVGQSFVVTEQRQQYVDELIWHETGHVFGGQHGVPNNPLADCPRGGPYEIMCQGFTGLQKRFGSANYTRVANVMKGALQRCSSTFSSRAACETAVVNDCSRILDYMQVQPCIDANILANCSDICSSAQKNARVVINSLTSPIGRNVVVAPGPGQNQ